MEITVTAEDLFYVNVIATCLAAILAWVALLWPWDRGLPSWNGHQAIARVTPLRLILGLTPMVPMYLSPILHYLKSPQYPDFWAYFEIVGVMVAPMLAAVGLVVIGLAVFGRINQRLKAIYVNEVIWDSEGLSWTAPRGVSGSGTWRDVRQIERRRSLNLVGKILFEDGRELLVTRAMVGASQLLDRAETAAGLGDGRNGFEGPDMPALRPA